MAKQAVIRVLLADDNTELRHSLQDMLQTYPDIVVIADASTGEEAVRGAEQLHPDVVVMDIVMPKMDGITATRQIKQQCPRVAVIGLTIATADEHHSAMREAGAVATLTKGITGMDRLYRTIKKAARSA